MDSKQRTATAFSLKESDRVPAGEAGIDHDVSEGILGRTVHWRSKAETTRMLWKGKRDELIGCFKQDIKDIVEAFGYDLIPAVLVPPADSSPVSVERTDEKQWKDECGRIWQYSPGNDSMLLMKRPRMVFSSADDLEEYFVSELVPRFGFRITGRQDGEYVFEFEDESRLDLLRYIVREFGGHAFIFARGFGYDNGNIEPMDLSEFEIISEFFGGTEEDRFIDIVSQPELVKKAVDLYAGVHNAMTDVYAGEGIDAVLSSGDFSSEQGPMVDPETIRSLFLPAMKREAEHIHERGMYAVTHNCGNNWDILDMLIEAGYDCLQSIQRSASMDLKKLKSRCGGRIALWGGIEISSLHTDTPEEACADVLYALRHAAPDGGFILGTCSTVSYGCSPRNYAEALKTLRKHGDYPIPINCDSLLKVEARGK